MSFASPQEELYKWKMCLLCAWGNGTSASEGGRNNKNYSEPVVSACFLNALKKVPDFV